MPRQRNPEVEHRSSANHQSLDSKWMPNRLYHRHSQLAPVLIQDRMIASAVVVPEEQPALSPAARSASPPKSKKRGLSFESDEGSKRPRISKESNEHNFKTNGSLDDASEQGRRSGARRDGAAEERKRGQRLFGALLGTLSQSSTSATQKRREIERRQQAKIRQQAEEDDQNIRQKSDELRRTRVKEQRSYDTESMHLRHTNTVTMANFLRTKAEPRLFFRPWDLMPEEEDQIKRQVEDAEADRDREREEHRRREQEWEEEQDVTLNDAPGESQPIESTQRPGNSDQLDPVGREEPSNAPDDMATIDTHHTEQTHDADKNVEDTPIVPVAEDDHAGDDNGEEVLETGEDTVLY
ncbi:hypothetical protein EJ05DRAFT_482278 [Pseudovirgaria hyperparasitica]|uniref:Pinin/SDK/MemA protein domain-containing protein n=1 Tax=Pseudovirgaria hyperparasitica TaxID=470096 RepID=A0A6A6WMP4_9PEZI|nr:uncharacterized protein EJ05DRAFT_482278 [Pseudovirgaria hyperparasitica]KAF2763481.1 hypothetical protein EJ05DRAFT_482278 [Pseudovirgaria hyperparasitica]